MKCCPNCFEDFFLKEFIEDSGENSDCDYCGSTNVKCVEAHDLENLFQPLANLYTPVEYFMPNELLKEFDGETFWEKVNLIWEVFSEASLDKSEQLLSDIFELQGDKTGPPQFLSSQVEDELEFWSSDEHVTRKLINRWSEFENELKNVNRFFPQKKINPNELIVIFQNLEKLLVKETKFYRARNSHKVGKFAPSNMGKPSADNTKNGRANPVGIAYLYLASDVKTAIEEIRPSVKDKVTVGDFIIKEDLRLVDLTRISPFQFYQAEEPEKLIRDIGFLYKLREDLSLAINPKDAELEYLPTQYLCELIKYGGWDGVIYDSSLSDGYNIVLFNDKQVECTGSKLYEVLKAEYQFIEAIKDDENLA